MIKICEWIDSLPGMIDIAALLIGIGILILWRRAK